MAKSKQAAWQFKGDGKMLSHKGRRNWTPEQLQGHEAHQKDRKRRKEK